MQIDRDYCRRAASHGIGFFEDAAVERAITSRHDPFRIGGRRPGAIQRFAHVACHRPGNEQYVSVARRGDKAQTKALDVVEGVIERMNLKLAAVARTGIDLTDRKAAAEPPIGRPVYLRCQLGERAIAGSRRRFGQRAARQAAKKKLEDGSRSYRSCPE
jgi:hypothetical protein